MQREKSRADKECHRNLYVPLIRDVTSNVPTEKPTGLKHPEHS
jgi:hypothetical protein